MILFIVAMESWNLPLSDTVSRTLDYSYKITIIDTTNKFQFRVINFIIVLDKINKHRSRSETRQTVFFFIINSITRAFSALFMAPLVELYIKVMKLLSLTPPINFSFEVLTASQ